MIQRDDLPPTPEWTSPRALIVGCRACTLSENLCACLTFDGGGCCSSCDHRAEVEPLLWTGDQV